jgi:D-alanyl-D-alanine carboxypeptidase (penicillin-binding protein 5/6)
MPHLLRLVLLALLILTSPARALEGAPSVAAQAWLLVDYHSGTVLAEHQADTPLPRRA